MYSTSGIAYSQTIGTYFGESLKGQIVVSGEWKELDSNLNPQSYRRFV